MPEKWGAEWDPDSTGDGPPLVPLRSIVSHSNLTLSSHSSPGFLLVRYLLGEWDNLQPLLLQLVLRP